jgi:polysaccharide pyruvyl transferase CsaB
MNGSTTRQLVVVSGYYGFDNLGDEAILEQLTAELKQLGDPQRVVVLSANPSATAARFAVRSCRRTDFTQLARLLADARLFISGGGGLFQDTRSPGSVLFYGAQMLMARAAGAKVMVYAQGIGPLQGQLSRAVARLALSSAHAVTVRDRQSQELLQKWGMDSELTADPVWCLKPSKLPDQVAAQLQAIQSTNLIALSLRQTPTFSNSHLESLLAAMLQSIPEQAHLLLLPLMREQDDAILKRFEREWRQAGRACTFLQTEALTYPSQYLSIFSQCRLLIGMRLHALIMALKVAVPVVGIEYDPKVSRLVAQFDQPGLILTKEPSTAQWQTTLRDALIDRQKLAAAAIKNAESATKLACQNFNVLARILNVHKNG